MNTSFLLLVAVGIVAETAVTARAADLIDSPGPGYREMGVGKSFGGTQIGAAQDAAPVWLRGRKQPEFSVQLWKGLGDAPSGGAVPFSSEIRLFDLSGVKQVRPNPIPQPVPFEGFRKAP
jgi:hypothetical protein